ncbi:MAG: hypothetical protein H6R01_1603 [Burkholderiaceae bacterium]|nr:hypothetical protein [Burkholderiaceae bacterium]
MLNLTPSLLANVVFGVLCILLLCACWIDARNHRIPNWLVLTGAALGLILNTVLPDGFGFISFLPGAVGFWKSLAGLALGLAIPMPLYVLRAMGAGDVKLMAMVGAFLGPMAIVGVILMAFVVGGLLSLMVVLRNGTMKRLFDNLHTMLLSGFIKTTITKELPTIEPASVSAGKMPYALAISGGTFIYFALAGNELLAPLYNLALLFK